MGNIVTGCRIFSSAHPITLRESTEIFLARLKKNGYSLETTPFMASLYQDLINQYAAGDFYFRAIRYYIQLAEKTEFPSLLNNALLLYHQTGKIWLLNEETLSFLASLHSEENEAYHQFIAYIKNACQEASLSLNASHLEILVASLKLQMSLPGYIEDELSDFLKILPPNYQQLLQDLRAEHEPLLDQVAMRNYKLHHAKAHALEIYKRTMLLLPYLENAFNTPLVRDLVFSVVGLLVEFHDNEQVECGSFSSVEQATSAQVLGWLMSIYPLSQSPAVKLFFEYLANKIIVLATTMVWGRAFTADLSQLYLMLEDAAVEAGMATRHPSNWRLHRFTSHLMLLVGVCDKNPGALIPVVDNQERNQKLNTYIVLKQHFQSSPLIARFFASDLFQPYLKPDESEQLTFVEANNEEACFEFSEKSADLQSGYCVAGYLPALCTLKKDMQIFFITLAPHMGMRAELSSQTHPQQVDTLIQFIMQARERFEEQRQFIAWFHEQFQQQCIFNIVDEIFFNAISKEVSFARSQTAGLDWTLNRFYAESPLNRPLINSVVPEQDAVNLIGLLAFYHQLDAAQKEQLAKELVVAVVLQAGYLHGLYQQQKKPLRVSLIEAEVESSLPCTWGFFIPKNKAVEKNKDSLEDLLEPVAALHASD